MVNQIPPTNETEATALRQLLDENAILNLMARFDDAVIRQDTETFRSLWVEDGIWEIGTFNPEQSKDINPLHAQGLEQVTAALQQFRNLNVFFFRTSLRSVITINADQATARTPGTEYARRHDGHGYNNVAMYQDELKKQDGNWFFVSRRYYYVWVDSSTPIPGSAIPLPTSLTRPSQGT